MSKLSRRMDAAAPVSPAEQRQRARDAEAARAKAEYDAKERQRARDDFKANRREQDKIRGYQKIIARLERTEAKRRIKLEKQIAAAVRRLKKRESK